MIINFELQSSEDTNLIIFIAKGEHKQQVNQELFPQEVKRPTSHVANVPSPITLLSIMCAQKHFR